MKKLTVLFVLLMCVNPAMALTLPELAGDYRFSENDLAMTQVQHILNIKASSEEARNLVTTLRAQNFECVAGPALIYKCKKFDKTIPEDLDIRFRIAHDESLQALHFDQASDDYALVNEGDALLEFERSQVSAFVGKKHNKLHLYVIDGMFKIKLYDSFLGNESYFFIQGTGPISQQLVVSKMNKKAYPFVIEDRTLYVYEAVWK